MLILLPPSEGKANAGTGDPLDLAALSLAGLNPARQRVMRALVSLCAGRDTDHAAAVLGLSTGLRGEVTRNARVRTAPTLPAGRLYTGVLYDALDLATLTPAAHQHIAESILIFSALWGAVRVDDHIPPYRCAIGITLPEVGKLSAYWRKALPTTMADAVGDQLVLDLRSAAYAAAWTPRGEMARRTASVRVLHEATVDGVARRSTVSHFNKATKGRLVRALAAGGAHPATVPELVTALRDLKYTVEEHEPADRAPWRLDVVVTEL